MTTTLVLDRGFQPVDVINWRDAVALLVRGSAEVMESYDHPVYSNEMGLDVYDPARFGPLGRFFDEELCQDRVRITLRQPAVIRVLRALVRLPQIRFSRRNIFLRDKHCCQYRNCRLSERQERKTGDRALPAHLLTFDHVIPKVQGGETCWENIVTACKSCNNAKGGLTPQQAGMTLVRSPRRPQRLPIILERLATPDQWRNWLYWNVELESGRYVDRKES